ncbi:hypothetical protein ACFOY2_05035 [Nonomuraea purpurea]|uniref:Uncharacterized protein n=1 Tax=Nonomuraea purpurea TaxID=1849276 RepID=A0ABV8G0E1_9ACTN
MSEKRIVNLTPHVVRVYHPDTPDRIDDLEQGLMCLIPPSGAVARLATVDLGTWCFIDGIPIEGVEYGHAHDLPPQRDGVHYVVSLALALGQQGRDDLLVPYSEVRNGDGTVVGCRVLAQVAG